jgi:hypothetical protein
MKGKSLLIILLLTFTATAQAEVYKWVDGGGAVHFSSIPPENVVQVEKKEYDAPAQSPETIATIKSKEEQQQKMAAEALRATQKTREKDQPAELTPVQQAQAKKAAVRAQNPQLFDILCAKAKATIERIDKSIASGRVDSYDPDAVMDRQFAKNDVSAYCK